MAEADLLFTELEEVSAVESKPFRPIYYLGCKAAFTSEIRRAIDAVDSTGGRVLDLFAGSGSVASALAAYRDVTAIDVQEYSRVLCSAALSPAMLSPTLIERISTKIRDAERCIARCFEPLINFEDTSIVAALKGDLSALLELLDSPPLVAFLDEERLIPESRLGSVIHEVLSRLKSSGLDRSLDTTVARNFGGVYFSFGQAAFLDSALVVASEADEGLRDTLKAVALSTASSLVNTVGKQFAQPIRPRNKNGGVKPGLAKTVYRDRALRPLVTYQVWLERYSRMPKTQGSHQAVRLDYIDALKKHGAECSVVYADPPYTRDHYSRFYHVLETMCLRDNPVPSKVVKNGVSTISRGVYREGRHQSPFCIRSTAPGAFDTLFSHARQLDLPLVLSYSPHEEGDGTHPRVVSMRQIVELAESYYYKVETVAIEGVTHNQLNRTGLKLKKRDHAEVIVKCYV